MKDIEKYLVGVACPHCKKSFGLPKHLQDTGDVTCPHCQQVSMRVPCIECALPFVFVLPNDDIGDIDCPHCNATLHIVNNKTKKELLVAPGRRSIQNILEDGYELERLGMIHAAIKEYKTVLEKDAENFDATFALGAAYGKLKEYAKSEFYLKDAIRINPKHGYTHRNLGILYKRLGKQNEMIAEFKKAIDLDPSLADEIERKVQFVSDLEEAAKNMIPHDCNKKCEAEAHKYAKSFEREKIKFKRFNNPPPRPQELIDGWQEWKKWLDDDVAIGKAMQELSEGIHSTSIGQLYHSVLESVRDTIIEFLGKETPDWLQSVPICCSYTGEPDACAMPGPNNHPIIVLDYAFMVGLERITKLFMVSWEIFAPYYSGTKNLDELGQDKDVRAIIGGMALSRHEFWEGQIQDPPLQVKVTGQDRSQASMLNLFMLHFIIAHELSHIVLCHLDNKTVHSINNHNQDIKVYITRQFQEKAADTLAIALYKNLYKKHPGVSKFILDSSPIILMKYFDFIEPPTPSEFSEHPDPLERLEYISDQLSYLSPDAQRYIEHFNFLVDFAKKVLG